MKRETFINGLVACTLVAAISTTTPTLASLSTPLQGDAAHGKALYQGCQACHSIDENDIGPRHRGVVGRRAAGVEDYTYSPALKNSGLIWDEPTLDRWLFNPSALVPGTKCSSRSTTRKLAQTSSRSSRS
jgi:cytochrome c